MHLGQIIKNYRTANSLTIEEFGQKSGLSRGYISMLEKNRNPKTGLPIQPSIVTIKAASMAMGLSLDELMRQMGDNEELSLDGNAEPFQCSKDEQQLLTLFRSAAKTDQKAISLILQKYDVSKLDTEGENNR